MSGLPKYLKTTKGKFPLQPPERAKWQSYDKLMDTLNTLPKHKFDEYIEQAGGKISTLISKEEAQANQDRLV